MILFNEIREVENNDIIIPNVFPSNILKLYDLYDIEDKFFNEVIDVTNNHRKIILSNTRNPSGALIFKMMKNFKWTYSMLYDINNNVEIEYNKKYLQVIQLLKVEKDKVFLNFYDEVIEENFKNYLMEGKKIRVCYSKVDENLNGKYSINTYLLSFKISKEKSNDLLEIISNEKEREKYDFYIVTANIYEVKKETININTFKNLDIETNNKLLKYPFKRCNTITIDKKEYIKNRKNNYLIKEKYSILTNDGIKVTNILSNEYLNENDDLKFTYFTEKNIRNKLKVYRILKKKSLHEMAEIFDMSISSYKLMENDINNISNKSMWIIENVLGILLENMLDIDKF